MVSEQPDLWENEPRLELVGRVFIVKAEFGYSWDERILLYVQVERSGLIQIEGHSNWFGTSVSKLHSDQQREIYSYLQEWELGRWQKVGPDDREFFATKDLDPEYGI